MQNALNNLLKVSFDNNLIDGAVIMSANENGYSYCFYTDFAQIKKISPFHPVMKINGAKIHSAITKENDNNSKILFLFKPCEVRACVELKKLNQLDLNNSILVSYTCPGCFEFKEGNNFNNVDSLINDFINGNLSDSLREICRNCINFCGKGADITINLFDNSFIALTGKGEDFLNSINIEYKTKFEPDENLEKIKEIREKNNLNLIKDLKKYFKSEDKVVEYFDKCIGCHACSHSCPICYCRQCYFESETFKYYPDTIKRKLQNKNAIRLPLDRVLFHLGRVTHMATSCVNCGMCEDVCPVNIKVSQFFKYLGNNIQNTFNYTPGINREEPLPLLTFKENEFQQIED